MTENKKSVALQIQLRKPDTDEPDDNPKMQQAASVKKEDKFFVLLIRDIHNYLTEDDVDALVFIARRIRTGRERDNKPQRSYIVCGQHEPYAEKVWQLILEGEREKQLVASKPVQKTTER